MREDVYLRTCVLQNSGSVARVSVNYYYRRHPLHTSTVLPQTTKATQRSWTTFRHICLHNHGWPVERFFEDEREVRQLRKPRFFRNSWCNGCSHRIE